MRAGARCAVRLRAGCSCSQISVQPIKLRGPLNLNIFAISAPSAVKTSSDLSHEVDSGE